MMLRPTIGDGYQATIETTGIVAGEAMGRGKRITAVAGTGRMGASSSVSFFPPSCLHCSSVFLDAYCLREHAKEVHGDRRFDCSTCGKRFRDSYDLRQHINSRAHSELVSDEFTGTKQESTGTNDDGAGGEARSTLSDPQAQADDSGTHGPPLLSSFPSAASPSSSPPSLASSDSAMLDALAAVSTSVNRHLQQTQAQARKRSRPTNSSSTVCETCGKAFKCSSLLANHMRVHTHERPFVCEFPGCSKRFTERSNLTKHTRAHSRAQPFKCQHEACGKAFTVKCNLQTHMRIHTNEKPFACERAECGQRFTGISDLRRHSKRHVVWDRKDDGIVN